MRRERRWIDELEAYKCCCGRSSDPRGVGAWGAFQGLVSADLAGPGAVAAPVPILPRPYEPMHIPLARAGMHSVHYAAQCERDVMLQQRAGQHAVKYARLGCVPTSVQWLDTTPGNVPTVASAKTRRTVWRWPGTCGGDVPLSG